MFRIYLMHEVTSKWIPDHNISREVNTGVESVPPRTHYVGVKKYLIRQSQNKFIGSGVKSYVTQNLT